MHLLTLVFATVLLPTAYTRKCYRCLPGSSGTCEKTEHSCASKAYLCGARRIVSFAGGSKLSDVHMHTCVLHDQCGDGSVNFGISRLVITSHCCAIDLCNNAPAPEFNKSHPNGKRCYHCDAVGCKAPLQCMGNENLCITKTVNVKGEEKIAKGCASEQMCSMKADPQVRAALGGEVSCCEGDLCNSASSISAGLLLLVTPLVSLLTFS